MQSASVVHSVPSDWGPHLPSGHTPEVHSFGREQSAPSGWGPQTPPRPLTPAQIPDAQSESEVHAQMPALHVSEAQSCDVSHGAPAGATPAQIPAMHLPDAHWSSTAHDEPPGSHPLTAGHCPPLEELPLEEEDESMEQAAKRSAATNAAAPPAFR
jgi:hypothetical protein